MYVERGYLYFRVASCRNSQRFSALGKAMYIYVILEDIKYSGFPQIPRIFRKLVCSRKFAKLDYFFLMTHGTITHAVPVMIFFDWEFCDALIDACIDHKIQLV